MYKQQVNLRIRNEVRKVEDDGKVTSLLYIYCAISTNKSFTVKVYYAFSLPYTEQFSQRSFTLTSTTCSYF